MSLPKISQQEFERRWHAAQEAMESSGLDVLLAYGDDHAVFGPANVRYLVNFPVHFEPACVVLPRMGEPVLVTGPESASYAEVVAAAPSVAGIEEFAVPGEEYPYLQMRTLGEILSQWIGERPQRIGLAGLDQMASDTWERLQPALQGAAIVRADELLQTLRKRKSDEEIKVLRYAFDLAARGMEAAIEACHVGIAEYEVAAAAEYAMRCRGAEGTAIDTIVASGFEHTTPIIYRAGSRQLQPNEPICLTLAARYEGYSAPIGRLVHLGDPSPELRQVADVALEAQRRAVAALCPGTPCRDVDAVARSYLEEHGYARYCAYGVAHSVGTQEFEPPFFGPSNVDVVESQMVVSVDIPLFFAPWGGFRLEDAFLVTSDGAQPLTKAEPGLAVRRAA